MRAVYAVGRAGWPFQVHALFVTEPAAQHHAQWDGRGFEVFPLPVYGTYEDCPSGARMDDSGVPPAWRTLSEDEIEFARMLEDGDPPPTVHAVRGYSAEEGEIYVLYASAQEAQRHVDAAYPHMAVRSLPVR